MPAPEPIPDLLKAVNEASGKAFALWITFLTVGTYLAISIGTTTDAQFLTPSSSSVVKLPLLGVDLPLLAFYGFAPALLVVLHLYVLIQLLLLANLLRLFDAQLQRARMLEQDRVITRGQLDKFVFTQSQIGAPRDKIVRGFLLCAVNLSFVIGPVCLLLGFQWRLVPVDTLRAQTAAWPLLDLALLFVLWPRVSHNAPNLLKLQYPGLRVAIFGLLVTLSIGLATHTASVARPLSLANATLDNLSLRGRDLKLANLFEASLINVDLRDTDLRLANLGGANLRGADLRGADLRGANLRGANLRGANLRGANLGGADLTGVNELTEGQLDQACGTDAKIPSGLTLKPCSP
jgi:hypothetical protein